MPRPAHSHTRAPVDRATLRRPLEAGARSAIPADATDAEIDQALAQVNQDALFDEERSIWEVELWDRRSPINEVPAKVLLRRRPSLFEGSEDIYLLRRNGRVAMVQPHDPFTGGRRPIAGAEALTAAEQLADRIASERANHRAVQAVAAKIRDARERAANEGRGQDAAPQQ